MWRVELLQPMGAAAAAAAAVVVLLPLLLMRMLIVLLLLMLLVVATHVMPRHLYCDSSWNFTVRISSTVTSVSPNRPICSSL